MSTVLFTRPKSQFNMQHCLVLWGFFHMLVPFSGKFFGQLHVHHCQFYTPSIPPFSKWHSQFWNQLASGKQQAKSGKEMLTKQEPTNGSTVI